MDKPINEKEKLAPAESTAN